MTIIFAVHKNQQMSEERSLNFLEEIIENDLKEGKYKQIITRFPPEPNGYLHIGHAKTICLNFGLPIKYGGYTNLRFDDTNPVTEETEYVEGIKDDVRWLGYEWKHELYASDYFDTLYGYAEKLISKGLAYVDDSTSEEIAAMKGTPTQPGQDGPYRNRSVEENLDLFRRMKEGEFPDGSRTLRAKIDMAHPNMIMRDPLLYRIKHAHHHRTGDQWCLYPMYDFAHGQSDAIEGITHSICTLEFVPHRELYDWCIEKLELYPSHQYEMARLNMTYTVMSKRKLMQLVNQKMVSGWDDPRMPTIAGMRRKGYTPESIRDFCERVGVARRENLIEISLLEFCVREHLNKVAQRRMVVFDPLKITLTNYPADKTENVITENNPEDPNGGTREVPFSCPTRHPAARTTRGRVGRGRRSVRRRQQRAPCGAPPSASLCAMSFVDPVDDMNTIGCPKAPRLICARCERRREISGGSIQASRLSGRGEAGSGSISKLRSTAGAECVSAPTET